MGNTVGDGTTPSQPTEEQLELRLPEEIITKLAIEAEVRDMGIGELIGALDCSDDGKGSFAADPRC